MENFKIFLKKACQISQQKPLTSPIKICLGNVSVDMDSVLGSMTLAYYYYLKHNIIFIPAVNCKRSFFPMKLDIIQHLNKCKLNEIKDELVFQEEILELNENIDEVALIDHNKLDNSQEKLLGHKIKRIVDHHIDNEMYKDQLIEKQIELIGSATTLVIDRILKEFPECIDPDFAYFLQAPLVLDSYFFDENLKGSKWTEKDWEVYGHLNQVTKTGKEYFDELFNAITNVELNLGLGMGNLLIKDYKTYYLIDDGKQGIGVGTVYVPLKTLQDHFGIDHIASSIEELMKERSLAFYGILTNYLGDDNQYHKEVLLYNNHSLSGFTDDTFHKFCEYLDQNEGYGLKEKQTGKVENGGIYYQWFVGNIKYSRKDFEKLLVQHFPKL